MSHKHKQMIIMRPKEIIPHIIQNDGSKLQVNCSMFDF